MQHDSILISFHCIYAVLQLQLTNHIFNQIKVETYPALIKLQLVGLRGSTCACNMQPETDATARFSQQPQSSVLTAFFVQANAK